MLKQCQFWMKHTRWEKLWNRIILKTLFVWKMKYRQICDKILEKVLRTTHEREKTYGEFISETS